MESQNQSSIGSGSGSSSSSSSGYISSQIMDFNNNKAKSLALLKSSIPDDCNPVEYLKRMKITLVKNVRF
jgi:hypothetical protein